MTRTQSPELATLQGRVHRIAAVIDERKGENIVVLDLRGLSDFADAFVVATVRSRTHLRSLAGAVVEAMREIGLRPAAAPDRLSDHWAVIDYGDVIVHLFDGETRTYYDLEALWGDAEIMDWERASA